MVWKAAVVLKCSPQKVGKNFYGSHDVALKIPNYQTPRKVKPPFIAVSSRSLPEPIAGERSIVLIITIFHAVAFNLSSEWLPI
jgi:hypothetical protein